MQFARTAEELMKDLLPLNGAKNVDRYVASQPAQRQLTEGTAGTPPGAEAAPSSASSAVPASPGIPPGLSMETASTPGMGGMARGLLM
jgi:hypothetical protein